MGTSMLAWAVTSAIVFSQPADSIDTYFTGQVAMAVSSRPVSWRKSVSRKILCLLQGRLQHGGCSWAMSDLNLLRQGCLLWLKDQSRSFSVHLFTFRFSLAIWMYGSKTAMLWNTLTTPFLERLLKQSRWEATTCERSFLFERYVERYHSFVQCILPVELASYRVWKVEKQTSLSTTKHLEYVYTLTFHWIFQRAAA